MLIIEVDGAYHAEKEKMEDDKVRAQYLQRMGFSVIRFPNEEVLFNIEKVIDKIKDKKNKV